VVTSSATRHVNADKTNKLIRDFEVTAAAAHHSRVLETLRDGANTAESARGISPRAAHRTGYDTLASSGSCHRKKASPFRCTIGLLPFPVGLTQLR